MVAWRRTIVLLTSILCYTAEISPSPTTGGKRESFQCRQISRGGTHGRFFPALLLFILSLKRCTEGSPAILIMPRLRKRNPHELRRSIRWFTAGDSRQSKSAR